MLKLTYILIIALYIGVIIIWFCKFPISYRIIGGNYNLIEDRDLTITELDALEKAYGIRRIISGIFLYSSVVVSVLSYIFLRNNILGPAIIIKLIMYIAGFIAIILLLVNGIHFVPGPPIR